MSNKNEDVDFVTDIDTRAIRYIGQFEEHGRKSEELYDAFNDVFRVSVTKAKNSMTMTGGLRDLSEAAKSLSSIRGDALNATSKAFDATLKVAEHKLRKEKNNTEGEELQSHTILMQQLAAAIHQNNNTKGSVNLTIDPSTSGDAEALAMRFSDIKTGKIKVNVNELSMKHDFNGVVYRYDCGSDKMVVLDSTGRVIQDYPIERIPEPYRFKKYVDGIPTDGRGQEIKPFNG